jgi:hypothetical protein
VTSTAAGLGSGTDVDHSMTALQEPGGSGGEPDDRQGGILPEDEPPDSVHCAYVVIAVNGKVVTPCRITKGAGLQSAAKPTPLRKRPCVRTTAKLGSQRPFPGAVKSMAVFGL